MAPRDSTLRQLFLARLPDAVGKRLAALPTLGPTLDALYAKGQEAWPGLQVPATQFAQQLAFRFPTGRSGTEVLGKIHAADLFLACACAAGAPGAVVELRDRFVAKSRAAVAQVDPAPQFVEDALAQLLAKLAVAEGASPPRISEYAGRGPLLYFVRTAASFTAVDLARAGGRPHAPLDEAALAEASGVSAELEALRQEHGQKFQLAFDAAVQSLHPRDRTLLRMHFLEGLGVDALGTFYRVHRSTAARWILLAREALWDATRRELAERLRLRPSQLESLLRTLQSNLVGTLRVSVLRRER